jgi:hypothetical protein
MFWWLYLAHLLSDYPFQPTWMVTNKTRWPVLLLHSGVHFVTSFVLIGQARTLVWPYLLLLTTIHFTIDLVKMRLTAQDLIGLSFLTLSIKAFMQFQYFSSEF